MNLIVIQATDEELATMTVGEILARAAAPSAAAGGGRSLSEELERVQPYTVVEVARMTGLCTDTVYEKCRAGTWATVPGTARVLVPVAEMVRILGVVGV